MGMDQSFREAYRTWDRVKCGFFRGDKEKSAAYFLSEPGQGLGAQYKCQIALMLACEIGGCKQKEFRNLLLAYSAMHPNEAPRVRTDGPKNFYADTTWYNWLHGKNSPMPWGETLGYVVEHVLQVADADLSRKNKLTRPGSLYRLLIDYEGTARQALSDASFLLASKSQGYDWRRIEAHIFGVIPTTVRESLGATNFDEKYEAVCNNLVSNRSVQVTGPRYSGKNNLLRRVVLDNRTNGFQIESGSLLQICALSLHEISSTEAIANVASFYRKALGVSSTVESINDLLGEIAHFSKQFPALIVISGVDAIDSDEIVRALRQDQLGEMISRILKGHPESRLLVSVSSEERLQRRRLPARGTDDRILTFDETIDLTDSNIAPTNYEYHAVRSCAEVLCTPERGKDREQVARQIAAIWYEDAELRGTFEADLDCTHQLASYISETLLSDAERFTLGLVSLSHDGLKPSTLISIFEAIRDQLRDELKQINPVDALENLPNELVRKPASAANAGPECYQIERALRDPLLIQWSTSEYAAEFRLANWGMARAAAGEARRLRLHSGVEVSAGRDVQVLLFLLACVEPANCNDLHEELPAESLILPSLSKRDAPFPQSADILRFVYTTLFERDLARSAENGVQIFDAQLRLTAVYPFIDNRWPWLTYPAFDEQQNWTPAPDKSPWLALDLDAKLRLLAFASSAASRLGLRAIISACSQLARDLIVDRSAVTPDNPEPLINLSDRQFEIFSRIRRYELDFGILLGGNPDADAGQKKRDPKSGLEGIEARILMLINTIPKPQSEVGRREIHSLQARHAEVLHLRGKHDEALRKYEETAGLTASEEPEPGTDGMTLSGRSRRMYTRLLIQSGRGHLHDEAENEAVIYEDNLPIPTFGRAALSSPMLERAKNVVEESLRNLSHGTMNDWIGAKIDHARLAAAQLHYRQALDLLDEAQHLVGASGASRDVLLEYLSVRGRALADAAAFAMGAGATSPKEAGPHEAELQRLTAYLKLDFSSQHLLPWQRASLISESLSVQALESLNILKNLVTLPTTGETRYAIFAGFLEVWIDVVRSREPVGSDDLAQIKAAVRVQLLEAAQKFNMVLVNMVATGYMAPLPDVRLLIAAFRAAKMPVKEPDGFPGLAEPKNIRNQPCKTK